MEHGPYEAWQVIGCALTLIVLVVALSWRSHLLPAVLVVPAAFSVSWAIASLPGDSTGLSFVSLAMVPVGTLVGAALTAVVTRGVRQLAGSVVRRR